MAVPPTRRLPRLALPLCILFCLILTSPSARAQTCELWAGDPPECAPHLQGRVVYLFAPLTQTLVADQIRNLTAQISQQVALLAPSCANASLPFACRSAFPRCVLVNDTITGQEVSVFEAQCRATCETVNKACGPVYAAVRADPINCTEPNTFVPSLDFYPTANLTFRLPSNATYDQPCEGSSLAFKCPVSYLGELVPIPESEQADFYVAPGLQCWKCPFPIYFSDTQYNLMWYGCFAIGLVSFLLTVFTLIPFLVNWRKRMVFPTLISFYAILPGCLLGFTYVCTLMNGWKETYCETPYRSAGPNHVSCVIQGFCIVVFSLMTIFATTALMFNVFCSLFLQKEVKKWWHWPELAFCWGIPLLFGVLYLSFRQGYYNEANVCFISDFWPPGSRDSLRRPWITWSLWYFPISILGALNTIMIVCISYRLFQNASNFRTVRMLLMRQWRTFFYWLFMAYTCGYVFGMWVDREYHRDKITEALQDFTLCLFFTQGDSRDCRPKYNIPKAAGIGLAWTNAVVGVWFFVVFGLSTENLKTWRLMLSGNFWAATASGSTHSRRSGNLSSMTGADSVSGAISRL